MSPWSWVSASRGRSAFAALNGVADGIVVGGRNRRDRRRRKGQSAPIGRCSYTGAVATGFGVASSRQFRQGRVQSMRLQSVAGAPGRLPGAATAAPICVEVMSATPRRDVEGLVDELAALCAASLAVQIKAGKPVVKLLNLTGLAAKWPPRGPDRRDPQRPLGTCPRPGLLSSRALAGGDRGGLPPLRRALRFPATGARTDRHVHPRPRAGEFDTGADPAVDPRRTRPGRFARGAFRRGPYLPGRDVASCGRRGPLVDGS